MTCFIMPHKLYVFLLLFFCLNCRAIAQKPFAEGIIVYKVKLESTGNNLITGYYTFTIKGDQVRKEIKMNNGYQDIVILYCGTKKSVSLQNLNGKKYAIELNMPEMINNEKKFQGFTISGEQAADKNIAGCKAFAANISYTDGTNAPVYYTKEWRPTQPNTFDRFPNAVFLPLDFYYKDEHGMTMWFEAEKIEPGPVENAVFRIPHDYKIISYAEYKELNK